MSNLLASDLEAGDFIKVDGEILRLHRVPIKSSPVISVGYIKRSGKGKSIGDLDLRHDEEVDVVARWPKLGPGWFF